MVLLLVVVITILGVSLFTMNMSASKQFTKKEEQVQARHLAEMGVMHYQEKISEEVKEFNKEKPVIYYKDNSKGKDKENEQENEVDDETTREEHTKKLCKKINEVSKSNLEETLITGDYEVEIEEIDCENITAETKEISIGLLSEGFASKTTRIIEAEVTVAAEGSRLSEGEKEKDKDDDKPLEPSDKQVKEVNFLEIDEIIHKRNSLHIKGDLTAVKGNSRKKNLTVDGDLYIGGEIFIHNHTCVVVKGDLTVVGDIDIKNTQKTFIVVQGNAYFSRELNDKNSKAIYVNGKVNSENRTSVKSYDDFYKLKKDDQKSCDLKDEGPNELELNEIKWDVEPKVNANYFP